MCCLSHVLADIMMLFFFVFYNSEWYRCLYVFAQILVAKSPVAPFAAFIYTIGASGFILQS